MFGQYYGKSPDPWMCCCHQILLCFYFLFTLSTKITEVHFNSYTGPTLQLQRLCNDRDIILAQTQAGFYLRPSDIVFISLPTTDNYLGHFKVSQTNSTRSSSRWPSCMHWSVLNTGILCLWERICRSFCWEDVVVAGPGQRAQVGLVGTLGEAPRLRLP